MTAEGIVGLAALGLAVWAAAKSLPRPTALDWERLFKVALSTAIRGELERAGGERGDWSSAVLGRVLYHPAGRRPEALLAAPSPDDVAVPARPGERALAEALAKLPDPVSRFSAMYKDDPAVEAALLCHPDDLGPDYDPRGPLGPASGWDAVAAWGDEVQAAVARRLSAHVLLEVGGTGALAEAMGAAVPALRAAHVPVPREGEGSAEALAGALLGVALRPEERLLLVCSGEAALATVAALAGAPGARDRVRAVVSLGGDLQGGARAAWMAEHFTHDRKDLELNLAVPYLAVVATDPARPLARPWADQRFPDPPLPSHGRQSIDPIDLGPLVLADLDPAALARALWVVLAFRVG